MIHFCFCISGFSGSGKDEIAIHLIKNYHAIQTGLADPAKRHLADVYGFTERQLFGPSQYRNTGDSRYPKPIFFQLDDEEQKLALKNGDPRYLLSPRETLQKYCELLNDLHLQTWIRKGVLVHLELADSLIKMADENYYLTKSYQRMKGICWNESNSSLITDHIYTCFSDFRHIHEINFVRSGQFKHQTDLIFKPVLIRVKRPSVPSPPFPHRSETEQATIPDSRFDFIIDNDSTIEALQMAVDRMVQVVKSPSWNPKLDLI